MRTLVATDAHVSRTVLINVLGTSPQIVTETLYVLTQQEGARPDEIHIWTTTVGKDLLEKLLLDRNNGKFLAFRDDYGIPELPFPKVHVFRDVDGAELGDIRSDEDNAAMLDQLVDFVRGAAAVPGTRLLCSAAGGRKTMGIALALALQLHGRPGDRLFHVLVRPAEFEHVREFFYPPPQPMTLTGRDGVHLDTANAVIELAEVPLVLLREHLPDMADDPTSISYSQLVQQVQARLLRQAHRPSLHIDVPRKRVIVDDLAIDMSPVQVSLYALLADMRRRCSCNSEDGCKRCSVSSQDLRTDDDYAAGIREKLQRWLERVRARQEREDELERWTDESPDERGAVLSQTASRVNSRIKQAANQAAWIDPYLIKSERRADTTLYRLSLPAVKISFLE